MSRQGNIDRFRISRVGVPARMALAKSFKGGQRRPPHRSFPPHYCLDTTLEAQPVSSNQSNTAESASLMIIPVLPNFSFYDFKTKRRIPLTEFFLYSFLASFFSFVPACLSSVSDSCLYPFSRLYHPLFVPACLPSVSDSCSFLFSKLPPIR